MNAQEIFNQVVNQPGFDIVEGEHAIDGSFESVEFDYKHNSLLASGSFGYQNDQLIFSIAYEIDGEIFDIEHVRNESGEECVYVPENAPFYAVVFAKDDRISKVEFRTREKHETQHCLVQNDGKGFFQLA